MISPEELMQMARDQARRGMAAGQSPFGCAIAWKDRLVACAHNSVLSTIDITAHAEINALRTACHATRELFFPEALVATTCEPCPMCLAALHWARVGTIYYGARIEDAQAAGFHELTIPAREMVERGGSSLRLVADVQRAECQELFREWLARPDRQAY
ncbi:MAG: nucleoside deaminase [Pirellulales bacterium]